MMQNHTYILYEKIITTILLVFVIGLADAKADDLALYGGITSDSTLRGISQSVGKSRLQFSLDWNHPNGIFLGSKISVGEPAGKMNRKGEYYLYAGYFSPIGKTAALEFSLAYYGYDGDFPRSWNYLELRSDYHIDKELSMSLSYTDDYYGRGKENIHASINWQPKIFDNIYGLLMIGNTYMPDSVYASRIKNYNVGIITSFDRWNFQLGYYYADKEAEIIHGSDTAGGRLAIEINYAIF